MTKKQWESTTQHEHRPLSAERLEGQAALIEALFSKDNLVRSNAASSLNQMGTVVVEPLLQMFARGRWNSYFESSAQEVLVGLGAEAVPILMEALHHPDFRVRWFVAEVLGLMHDRRAVEPLIQSLHDPHIIPCEYAVRALGRLGDQRAVEPL